MASSASALNSVAIAFLLALIVVAAGAARTEPDAKAEMVRLCHSPNRWSDPVCRDECQASGFSGYDFAPGNAATGDLARCCCCPKGKICIQIE